MHYLCLVYGQEDDHDGRDREAEAEAHALVDSLAESGYDISVVALALSHESTAVRVTGDGLVLTDGPAVSGPLRLRSVYVLGARDLNEAVRLAVWLPEAHSATIEIRPIQGRSPRTVVTPQHTPAAPAPASPADQPASAAD
ncbi:MAG: hypothetical protein KC442_00945 [Thermomicrobiales bacterium]|nr:hypothetical protein [Thermomicrobiales bacterium]